MDEVLDMFSFLGESLDVLNEETTTQKVEIYPLDEVFDAFSQLGDSLDMLNVDVHPIDQIVEEFGQLEEQLNIFKESMNESIELMTEPIKVAIDSTTAYDAFHSLAETVTGEKEISTEVSSYNAFNAIAEAVTENMKIKVGEIQYDEAFDENVKILFADAPMIIEAKEEYTSPIVHVMRLFGDLWESLAGVSDQEERSNDLQPSTSSLSHADVHLLMFLVFAILFLLVLSFLLCSYCKRKMWEREQWREVESDTDSDCSGSWISIDSSTQVSPIMTTTAKDKFEEVYWFRQDLDISPSIVV